MVSIVHSHEIDVTKLKSVKHTTIEKATNILDMVKPYKTNDKSILAEIIKQQPMEITNGKSVVRIVFKNLETGKPEAIFSDEPLNGNKGDILCLDYQSWNKYSCKQLPELKQIIETIRPSRDSVNGVIQSFGETTIRGKQVWHVELKTVDGAVKKYGDNLKEQISKAGFNIGDSITINNTVKEVEHTVKQPVFEVKDLSQDITAEIANRIANIKNVDISI